MHCPRCCRNLQRRSRIARCASSAAGVARRGSRGRRFIPIGTKFQHLGETEEFASVFGWKSCSHSQEITQIFRLLDLQLAEEIRERAMIQLRKLFKLAEIDSPLTSLNAGNRRSGQAHCSSDLFLRQTSAVSGCMQQFRELNMFGVLRFFHAETQRAEFDAGPLSRQLRARNLFHLRSRLIVPSGATVA